MVGSEGFEPSITWVLEAEKPPKPCILDHTVRTFLQSQEHALDDDPAPFGRINLVDKRVFAET